MLVCAAPSKNIFTPRPRRALPILSPNAITGKLYAVELTAVGFH